MAPFTSLNSLQDSSSSTNSKGWAKSQGAHPGGTAPGADTGISGGLKKNPRCIRCIYNRCTDLKYSSDFEGKNYTIFISFLYDTNKIKIAFWKFLRTKFCNMGMHRSSLKCNCNDFNCVISRLNKNLSVSLCKAMKRMERSFNFW